MRRSAATLDHYADFFFPPAGIFLTEQDRIDITEFLEDRVGRGACPLPKRRRGGPCLGSGMMRALVVATLFSLECCRIEIDSRGSIGDYERANGCAPADSGSRCDRC